MPDPGIADVDSSAAVSKAWLVVSSRSRQQYFYMVMSAPAYDDADVLLDGLVVALRMPYHLCSREVLSTIERRLRN